MSTIVPTIRIINELEISLHDPDWCPKMARGQHFHTMSESDARISVSYLAALQFLAVTGSP